jgi:hypothetical protein
MLSAVAVAVILGLLIAFLLKAKVIRASGAILCILFGLVIGITPIGVPVQHALNVSGAWLWGQVTRL